MPGHFISRISRAIQQPADRQRRDEKATERAIERAAISKAWVLENLRQNAERALQQRAVLDAQGKETGEFKYDGAVANRALELIGKELGMFINRRDLDTHRLRARASPAPRSSGVTIAQNGRYSPHP